MSGAPGIAGGALFYRRLASPLHATRAGVGAAWGLALGAAALMLYHPLTLCALLVAALAAAWGAGVGRELARALRTALIVALPIVAVNVLVTRDGLTVFARLGDLGPFGQGDLTVEALAYGAVIALKVTILILVTTLASLAVDPDELLGLLRRLSFRSALTASLAMRMVPLLAADAQRLAEAQRTRPQGAPLRARGRVAVLAAVIGGSLDRAMDVAATLELRGFAAAAGARREGTGRPRGFVVASTGGRLDEGRRWGWGRVRHGARVARPWSRHDLAFGLCAIAILALALAGRLGGAASFDAYPELQMTLDPGTLGLCAALLAAVLLPFCDRRGIEP
jgi:energy-coupling factor transport system permease protein